MGKIVEDIKNIGFIGVGVMGEPMCRNIAIKANSNGLGKVSAFDLNAEPLLRLGEHGVESVSSIKTLTEDSDMIFISLPSGKHVENIIYQSDGILANCRNNQVIIDLSTSPTDLAQKLATDLEKKGASFLDAPVARTREAAEQGSLLVMVGGDHDVFLKAKKVISCFASDVEYCGASGSGQTTKIINNMILFQNVVALAEGLTLGKSQGIDGERLLNVLTKGSADSFALQNHGKKSMVKNNFPSKAFSTNYALKDLEYALSLAVNDGINLTSAKNVKVMLEKSSDYGYGDEYFPGLIRVIEKKSQN